MKPSLDERGRLSIEGMGMTSLEALAYLKQMLNLTSPSSDLREDLKVK